MNNNHKRLCIKDDEKVNENIHNTLFVLENDDLLSYILSYIYDLKSYKNIMLINKTIYDITTQLKNSIKYNIYLNNNKNIPKWVSYLAIEHHTNINRMNIDKYNDDIKFERINFCGNIINKKVLDKFKVKKIKYFEVACNDFLEIDLNIINDIKLSVINDTAIIKYKYNDSYLSDFTKIENYEEGKLLDIKTDMSLEEILDIFPTINTLYYKNINNIVKPLTKHIRNITKLSIINKLDCLILDKFSNLETISFNDITSDNMVELSNFKYLSNTIKNIHLRININEVLTNEIIRELFKTIIENVGNKTLDNFTLVDNKKLLSEENIDLINNITIKNISSNTKLKNLEMCEKLCVISSYIPVNINSNLRILDAYVLSKNMDTSLLVNLRKLKINVFDVSLSSNNLRFPNLENLQIHKSMKINGNFDEIFPKLKTADLLCSIIALNTSKYNHILKLPSTMKKLCVDSHSVSHVSIIIPENCHLEYLSLIGEVSINRELSQGKVYDYFRKVFYNSCNEIDEIYENAEYNHLYIKGLDQITSNFRDDTILLESDKKVSYNCSLNLCSMDCFKIQDILLNNNNMCEIPDKIMLTNIPKYMLDKIQKYKKYISYINLAPTDTNNELHHIFLEIIFKNYL